MDFERILNVTRLTPEEKYHKAVPGLMKRIRDLYEALNERFGEDGLNLIRDVSTEYGRNLGSHVRNHLSEKGVKGVGRYVVRVFDMVGGDWTISKMSDTEMVIEVCQCPYPFTEDAVCKAHTSMEKALVETLDPDLEYEIGRSIPQGDSICEHIIRRKRH